MNTSTTSIRLRGYIATAIFAALGAAATTASHADDGGYLKETVKYGDLNVSNAQGAALLYTRIQSAARHVCYPLDRSGNLAAEATWKACINHAIAQAVRDVNEPALMAVYSAKTGRSLAILAAEDPIR